MPDQGAAVNPLALAFTPRPTRPGVSEGRTSGACAAPACCRAVQVDADTGIVTLWLVGDLDIECVGDLVATMARLAGAQARQLTLDVGAVTFLDCAALGGLTRAAAAAAHQGIQVGLCNASPAVRRLTAAIDRAGLTRPKLLADRST